MERFLCCSQHGDCATHHTRGALRTRLHGLCVHSRGMQTLRGPEGGMVLQAVYTQRMDKPPEVVRAFISDLRNDCAWREEVKASEIVSGAPTAAPARYSSSPSGTTTLPSSATSYDWPSSKTIGSESRCPVRL